MNEFYLVDGRLFEVAPNRKEEFLKKYPNAILETTSTKPKKQKKIKPVDENKPTLQEIGIGTAIGTAPGAAGAGFTLAQGFFNLYKGVPELIKATKETVIKQSLNLFGPKGLNEEEKNKAFEAAYNATKYLPGITGATANVIDDTVEFNDKVSKKIERINTVYEAKKFDNPETSIFNDFKSGNIKDAIGKTADGVIEAVPSILAAVSGIGGLALIGTSSAGSNYKTKAELDPTRRGDLGTFTTSIAQGGIELVSEMFTKGLLRGFGNTFISKITPNAIKNAYKTLTKNIAGRVFAASQIEGVSENVAQESNRFLDFIWDDEENLFEYQNTRTVTRKDGSSFDVTYYDVGNILERSFDTYLISSIAGGGIGLKGGDQTSRTPMDLYYENKLESTDSKKATINLAKQVNDLETLYRETKDPLIEKEIGLLNDQIGENKKLNRRVLDSFEQEDLLDYARRKIQLSESKRKNKSKKSAKIFEKEQKELDKKYNEQKAIILMLNFGPKVNQQEIRQKVSEKKSQSIREQVNNTYDNKTTNADWKSKVADQAIIKLIGKYGDDGTPQGPLGTIIKNKITGDMTRLPGFSRLDFISEVVTELTPHIRNFKPELAAANPKNNLTGWIGGFINNKISGVLGGKKATKEQFETEISGIQETQFDLDNSTQEALDLEGTRTPEQNAKLNDIAGITKQEAQKNAREILKSKLPGILEKSGRDKNQIRTAINNASVLKIADKVLDEMGGKFKAKEGANNQFASFLGAHYDILFGDNNIIPDYVKNKLELFKPKQVGRETMVEGDEAGKGKFEYENPTFDQVLNFYTDETKGLSTLRARKERLADIIAPEIIKNEMAEALADPDVKKDFLDRQKFLKKEIPQDAIPKLLEKIDRALEIVDQFGKTTLQGGPIPVVPAAKVFLNSLKVALKAGAKFSEALSKAIQKFKQALKGATKEQKSLAERIVGYHIKTIDDFNKLKESELIEDLSIFMNNDILNSSDIQDFASNAKDWKKLVKNVEGAGPAIDMRTETGRKKFLEIAEKNGFIEQIPESIWLTLQGTTDSLIPDKVKKELNLDKEELKTIRAADDSSLRTYGGNFPFKNVGEAKAWIDSMKAKGKKFAKEGVYKDMTTRVTKAQYDNLENLLDDKDFIQSQKNSLDGVKKLFLTFESLMKDNPKQNIPFVAAMLSSTSAFQGHFMRAASPVTFYEKGYKDGPYQQEHTLPATIVAKYLFLQAVDGNVKKSFKHVAKNFQQGALSNKSDDKLKGIGYNGESFTYKEKTPSNWFIKDNIWARYFNINVALQDGGILPENIVMAGGKTIADIYKVNNAGYGIKGVNFNNEVIQDFKVDEINVQAVKQVYKEKDLNKDFNNFLEKATGIGAEKVFSEAKATARGKQTRKVFGDYFVPVGAEDFGGLMHRTLAKGKIGEQQLKFYKENLYDTFNAANESITRERRALIDDFRALKNKLSNVPKKLKKLTSGGDFTFSNAVRVYIWNKQGMTVPGLSQTDLQSLVNEVQNNPELLDFSNQLINITKSDGYAKPENNWQSGDIATDLMALFNTSKRSKHLETWQNNVDQIFTKENLNKLEAAYGKSYRVNLEKTLERMKTGMNRKWGGDKTIQAYLDWVNGSVGAIMFLNTRSAVLQTISNINYINFKDNNPLMAAKAYANQPQFWKDFKTIFNSDYLRERRGGNQINVNENELAKAAEKGGIQGTISLLLNKGFIFTKIADSFAIASGGAPMYRNRINTYLKQGLSQKEAENKAFLDFKSITEETQQSSRPDRISEQQASNAGRLLLAFANTPMQYNRIIKRNAQDLIDGRGDPKEKITRIIYYSTIQNLLFNAMQKALFALAFAGEDEDEKEIQKYSDVANGMADTLLRGAGLTGNAVVAIKNVAIDVAKRAKKPRPNFQDAAWKALTISPPLHNKASKLRGAGYSLGYTTPENIFEPSLNNPALSAGANIISATTNIPLDRALRKAQNIEAAMRDEAEWWQRAALLMGWGTWELGMESKQDKKEKQPKISKRQTF